MSCPERITKLCRWTYTATLARLKFAVITRAMPRAMMFIIMGAMLRTMLLITSAMLGAIMILIMRAMLRDVACDDAFVLYDVSYMTMRPMLRAILLMIIYAMLCLM